MYRTIEEMCDEIRMQVRKETAASLWNEGIRDVELIARSTKLSFEEVRGAIGIKSE